MGRTGIEDLLRELAPQRLADQDRTRWDRDAITEGVELVSKALSSTDRFGRYRPRRAR